MIGLVKEGRRKQEEADRCGLTKRKEFKQTVSWIGVRERRKDRRTDERNDRE